jgi:hypothetical protein
MAGYIEFETAQGQPLFIEVEEHLIGAVPGIEKAGLLHGGRDVVGSARANFDDAVRTIVGQSVDSFTRAIEALARKPEEVELTFALKATGEIGNFAIAKVGGEANFTIRLSWKLDTGP